MKKDEFAYIGCRLLALFYGVKALFDVSSFVTVFVSWNSGLFPSSQVSLGMMYMQLIPLCLNILLAFLLWFAAERIVHFLLSETDISIDRSAISANQLQTVAFAAVGVLILGLTFPEIGRTLFRIIEIKKINNSAPVSTEMMVQIFVLGLRLIIGFFLVFGSKGLSGLLTRLRAPKFRDRADADR